MKEECVVFGILIVEGIPDEKGSLPLIHEKYWGMSDDLYLIENVLLKENKMLVPSILRPQVLEGLHAANQNVTGM